MLEVAGVDVRHVNRHQSGQQPNNLSAGVRRITIYQRTGTIRASALVGATVFDKGVRRALIYSARMERRLRVAAKIPPMSATALNGPLSVPT